MRDDTAFTDVTLVTEDGKFIEAHKVILSASSPFFKNILKTNKHPNPLVYLKGFNAKALHSLIDFMYHGKADVCQEDLDTFLSKAEELQLKGLTGGGEENDKQEKQLTHNTMPKIMPTKKTDVFTDYLENINKEELNDIQVNDINKTSTTIS